MTAVEVTLSNYAIFLYENEWYDEVDPLPGLRQLLLPESGETRRQRLRVVSF
jgi:hypothetical protein